MWRKLEMTERKSPRYFQISFGQGFFLMFCSFSGIASLVVDRSQVSRENYMVILFTFFICPRAYTFPCMVFLGLERMKYSTILNVISKLIFTAAIFIFIKDKDDYILQPVLVASGYFFVRGYCLVFYFCEMEISFI